MATEKGSAKAFWPQAAIEAVAFREITGRYVPVFVGDGNNVAVIHEAKLPSVQLPLVELHVGGIPDGQLRAVLMRLLEDQLQLLQGMVCTSD